jgi:hypothetical protein
MTRAVTAVHKDGLSREQLGHIRRFDVLSRLQENDWSGMTNREVGQAAFGGYRFQMAYGAYALGLAHRHRLPNAPAVFKPIFERLIAKMRSPEVWEYWAQVSRGGSILNAHLSDQLRERWDPVAEDNIMYSAYLNSMALMYNVLFDDDRYARDGALTIDYWSFFWGGAPRTFSYDQNSLTDIIYWQMVKNGYLGVACEPNCIFQICNQPAILGFRLRDQLTGESVAEEVIAGYKQAWARYGDLDAYGHYFPLVLQDSGVALPNDIGGASGDAWLGALMNMWNSDFVRRHYDEQMQSQLIPGQDGALDVKFTAPREVMGRLQDSDQNEFGWSAVWASEMGDRDTLDGLLAHADRYMNPTWVDGVLYYPRNDARTDDQGHRTLVEPLTGNTLLAYARLNTTDGLRALFETPWDRAHFKEPLVVELSDSVDITSAWFDRESRRLTLRARRRPGHSAPYTLALSNVPGDCSLTLDGAPANDLAARQDETLSLKVPDGGDRQMVLTVPTWNAE